MTLTYRSGSGANFSTGGSPTFPNPAGRAAGDFIVAILATKPDTMTTSGGIFHTFGTTIADRAALGMKYIVKVGDDPGPGGWGSMTMSYTSGGGQPGGQVMASFYKNVPGSSYTFAYVDGDDLTETGTSIACTGGSTLDLAAGDYLLFIGAGNDDYTLSSVTFSVPGCTLGTPVEVNATKTTTLLGDLAMHVYAIPVTAGTASGAPTMTATGSVSGKSGMLATFFRLREEGSGTSTTTTNVATAGLEALTTGTAQEVRTASLGLRTLVQPPQQEMRLGSLALMVLASSAELVNSGYTGWGVRL